MRRDIKVLVTKPAIWYSNVGSNVTVPVVHLVTGSLG